jgi:sec-independent protein translocase protein TatA
MITPLVAGLGAQELILILLVLILLFGASKLPELARGSGRALRIFKAETKGLIDEDDDDVKPEAQRAAELANKQAELDAKQAELDAERERLQRGDR